MKILGIDTSSKFLSIALNEDKDLITEEQFFLDRRHSSLLVPKIKGLLEKRGISIKDVGLFIVGLGPGSFTGLRIGISTVKGFGIVTKKPCIGIASIDSIALNAGDDDVDDGNIVVPVIDAKREQLYSAIYKKEKGHIARKSDYFLLKVDRLMKKVKGPGVFLGDGIALYKERIEGLNKKAVFLEEDYWYPRASNLIKIALRKNRAGKPRLDRLDPIYLYPKDCQVRSSKK